MKLKTGLALFFMGVVAQAADVTVSLKDGRQLFEGMSIAFGFDGTQNNTIRTFFEEARSRLPRDGSVTELTSSVVTTTATLSGLFCKALIDSDAAKTGGNVKNRWVHPDVDFTKEPAVALPDTVRAKIIESYAGLLWQRSPSQSEFETVNAAMTKSIADEPKTAAGTVAVLLVPCVAMASSLDFLVY